MLINESFKESFEFESVEELNARGGMNQVIENKETLNNLLNYIKKGEKWEASITVLKKSGRELFGHLKVSPLYDIDHLPIGGAIFFSESILEVIEEPKSFLDTLIENANDAIMVTQAHPIDEPGPIILYVNPAFTYTTGYRMDEVIGKNPRFLQGPLTDPFELKKIRKALEERTPLTVELINYKKDGSAFWVNFSLFPIYKNGVSTHFVSIQRDITGLKQSSEKLSSIIDALPANIILVDHAGVIQTVNKGWSKFLEENQWTIKDSGVGQLYSNICAKTFKDPADCQKVVEGLKEVLKGARDLFQMEYANDGVHKKQWFQLQISPLKVNQSSEVIVMHLDITERNLTKESMLEREEHYKSLFENHPDSICSTDLKGTCTSFNDSFSSLFDIPKSNLIYSSFFNLFNDQYLKTIAMHFDTATEGKPARSEVVIQRNNQAIELIVTSIPIIVRGRVIGVFHIFKDVTETRKSRYLLDESAKRVQMILESITDGFFALDKNFDFTYLNKEAERLLKVKREKLLGTNLKASFPEAAKSEHLEQYYKALRENISVHFEVFLDHLFLWIEISAYPSQEGLSVYFKDISDRKIAEQSLKEYNLELEKTNHELDQFVYRASHDLRAPLVSMLGLINIFRMENVELRKDEYLKLMVKSINKMDSFIQDIIFYSKNSRTGLIISKVNFGELIKESLENIKYIEQAKHIEIQLDIPDVRDFYSDVNRLEIIINNLLTNSIRYHDPFKSNPYIKIEVSIQEDPEDKSETAVIKVEDNGHGIPPKDINRIFEMFYRASQKTSGSGLGLYIVTENLKKLKGSIEVESKLGIYTSFFVKIPNLKSGME